ncbi:hypothetical protein [Devosia nitrariae]|nr:hypothetical protein [Devosia nitrariae]
MSMFEDWRGRFTQPPLPEFRAKVGRNVVRQITRPRLPQRYAGHDLVKTELKPPYHHLYIRHKGSKRLKTDLPVLTAGLARDAAIPRHLQEEGSETGVEFEVVLV